MTKGSSAATAMDQPELRGVLPAGSKLRSYEVIAALGQGNFGITYRAWDPNLVRDVAIKEYLPTALALRGPGSTVMPRSADLAETFTWGRERFLQEARTLGKLAHVPAVVRVHDFLEANGTAYMVMDLVEGETLQQRIARIGTLPVADIERLLHPLLDGLEQIHAVGFLHRDIKPANIIVDAKGNPTLIDFGASRSALAGRTVSMTAVFTPGFAAAEQFTAARQGPWTDIYGLSATLYNAITDSSPPNAVDRLLDDAYVPLGHIRPQDFPENLLNGIDAGLAVRGSDRPQNIAAWRLIFAGGEVPSSPSVATQVLPRNTATPSREPVGPPLPPVPVARSRPVALYAGMAAAALALAGGAYIAFAPKPGPTGVVLQDLTIEDLERALADRRRAEAEAVEKRRLEEEAQRRAEADATAKQAADVELAQARLRTQKAEEELAQLKAEFEARRQQEAGQKAAVDAAAQRAAEEAAQRKAEEEIGEARRAEEEAQRQAAAEAETKRQSEEALARAQEERQRADEEAAAKQRAEEEAAAKQRAEAEAATAAAAKAAAADVEKKAAEAIENGLRLAPTDRQRLQVALTALGFDTRGTDGVFGARSRAMLAGWQQKVGAPATGFLTAAQRDQLLRSAAPAVTRWEKEQKKVEDERKKADDTKVAAAMHPTAVAPPPAETTMPATSPDGLWHGTYTCGQGSVPSSGSFTLDLALRIANGSSSGGGFIPTSRNGSTMNFQVAVSKGGVTVTRTTHRGGNQPTNRMIWTGGTFDNNSIRANIKERVSSTSYTVECTLALSRSP